MKLLSLLHRWTGGLTGLLLALLGLTGAVLLWEGSWVTLPGASDPVAGDPAALGHAVERALAIDPSLTRITFASDEIGLHMASYADGGGAYLAQDGTLVDRWESLWGRPELWLFELHHYLLLGEPGKYTTGVLGLLLLAFAISGLVLWWRTRKTFCFRLWPARFTASAIVRHHRDLGAVAAPLLVLSALTGSAMVFPAMADAVLAPWAGDETAPTLPTGLSPPDETTDWAGLMASAQAAFPEAAPRRLMMPASPGAPLALRLKQDFEWTPNGRTYAWLDPASGRVVATDDPAHGGTASAITETFYPVHAAKVGGVVWRLVMTFGGFALVLLGSLATWSFWFAAPARPVAKPRAMGMAEPAE